MPTSAGSLALKKSVPPDDAYQVRRLREEGAIIIAKANMCEFAFSPCETVGSALPGYTGNPYARGDTEICRTNPGFDEDLYITAEAEAFVKWHAGQLTWAEATRNRQIQLRSAFAHIKPAFRTAASSAA